MSEISRSHRDGSVWKVDGYGNYEIVELRSGAFSGPYLQYPRGMLPDFKDAESLHDDD